MCSPRPAMGKRRVGSTVQAIVALNDGNPAGSRVAYQWQAEETTGSGTYQNATGSGSVTAAYLIPSADAGKKLRVIVTGVSPAVGSLTSDSTNAGTITNNGTINGTITGA